MTIRVLIVDDHPFVRRGLRDFLDSDPGITVVGEAEDGAEAVARVTAAPAAQRPDVVLMDLVMPGMDGIAATRVITAEHPDVKVVILTSFSATDDVVPALAAGASGYVLKDVQPEELVVALTAAHRGQTLWSATVTEAVRAYLAREDARPVTGERSVTAPRVTGEEQRRMDLLTPRERQVLTLLGAGKSNAVIAEELVVSEKTVKTHVSHILAKLGVTDRTQAAVLAVRAGVA